MMKCLRMSLSAVVACLLRRSNNGYEGRIGHYGEVGSLCLFNDDISIGFLHSTSDIFLPKVSFLIKLAVL